MSKHKKHHVKKHHWHNGILKSVEHFFETLEEAMSFAKANDSDAQVTKVYNTDGELVHTTAPVTATYA
jgi:hypothetical protein